MTTDEIKALTQRLRHYGDNDRDAAALLIERQAAQIRSLKTLLDGGDARNVRDGASIFKLQEQAADVQGERDANAILTEEAERLRAALESWKATVWAVARELDCLPSTFSDANGHVLKAAIKHMADARRYRWLRDDTDSDWAICEWSTREVDGIGYYRDSRRPDIVDAAIDAARAAADSQHSPG